MIYCTIRMGSYTMLTRPVAVPSTTHPLTGLESAPCFAENQFLERPALPTTPNRQFTLMHRGFLLVL